MYNRFIKTYLFTLLILSLPIGLNLWFLYSAGELASAKKVAHQQFDSGEDSLAAFATHDLTIPYKLALYEKSLPNIITIGSSRVMPLRQYMFKDKFLNLSRGMNDVEQGYHLVEELLKIHKPELAIIGIDFWWFVGHYNNPSLYVPPTDKMNLSINTLILPYKWLWEGKISYQYYLNTIGNISPPSHFGITAQIKGDGFYKDGSFYHASVATGRAPSEDKNFKVTLTEIQQGSGLFAHNQNPNHSKMNRFLDMVKLLEKDGVKVILFNHPLPLEVQKAIDEKEENYKYLDEIMRYLSKERPDMIDFNEQSQIQLNSCEFFDGYHEGEIALSKILSVHLRRDKDLERWINLEIIKENITQFSGLAFRPNNQFFQPKEIDFLKLGCRKL